MSEEDRPQKYSISNGGRITYSRSSKRQKQNKVPQRGLGVAKLEKMRLEEEQRMKASSSSNSSFNLPLSLPNFHPSSQIPLPSATTVPLSSSTVSVPVNRNGGFAGLLGYKSVPKDFGMDPGLGFLSSLLYKSNPNWTLPNVIQRKRQPQQPSSSSSSANLSSGTSSTLLPQVSMEPPLIQNNSHRYVPIRPMEKMIGIKRQNPFSMDVLPAPSFSFNFPTFAAPMNTNEEISSGSGSGVNLDHAGKTTFSEAPSYSASNSEMIYKGNENFNRDFDFLKLSHPHSTSSLHLKTTSTLTPYQGVQENQIPSPSEYIFIPPAANVAQTEQTRDELQNSNAVGGVDLNLKL
ncbi:PREDICTED: uncharacterized protein LOC109352856 [Lupinus angustifolius]|uniref:uncharacterized protein LOC109352856 n=1 Tax=Lupinus angustifolius TaxID=3871 RepID=UPI00092EF32F|nr:PREDICTED: uncharacterized protein LOC109352856 [Lupinus angustifolius]